MREEDTFLYGFADFANTCIAWMGHRCDPSFHERCSHRLSRSGTIKPQDGAREDRRDQSPVSDGVVMVAW